MRVQKGSRLTDFILLLLPQDSQRRNDTAASASATAPHAAAPSEEPLLDKMYPAYHVEDMKQREDHTDLTGSYEEVASQVAPGTMTYGGFVEPWIDADSIHIVDVEETSLCSFTMEPWIDVDSIHMDVEETSLCSLLMEPWIDADSIRMDAEEISLCRALTEEDCGQGVACTHRMGVEQQEMPKLVHGATAASDVGK